MPEPSMFILCMAGYFCGVGFWLRPNPTQALGDQVNIGTVVFNAVSPERIEL